MISKAGWSVMASIRDFSEAPIMDKSACRAPVEPRPRERAVLRMERFWKPVGLALEPCRGVRSSNGPAFYSAERLSRIGCCVLFCVFCLLVCFCVFFFLLFLF